MANAILVMYHSDRFQISDFSLISTLNQTELFVNYFLIFIYNIYILYINIKFKVNHSSPLGISGENKLKSEI